MVERDHSYYKQDKNRIMKKFYNILILVLIMVPTLLVAQQGSGNGPPNPPPSFCQIHPNHPNCINAVQVPLSDWYWEIGLMIAGTAFIYYKFKQKSIA